MAKKKNQNTEKYQMEVLDFDNDLPEYTYKEKRPHVENSYRKRKRKASPAAILISVICLLLFTVLFIRQGISSLGIAVPVVILVWIVELVLGVLTEGVVFEFTCGVMIVQLVLGYFFASVIWMILGIVTMFFSMLSFSMLKGYF